jgi:hypothetical protein
MIFRSSILAFILSSLGAGSLSAQAPVAAPYSLSPSLDFSKIVVPITELKFIPTGLGGGFEGKFGTGFCLDPNCRYIATAYHVAILGQPRRIRKQRVVQRYLATGPDDEGATLNEGPFLSHAKYTFGRDLAIFELRYPLPDHHGIAYSLDGLLEGHEVDIYAYPKGAINPIRSLQSFHGTFKGETTNGLLAFEYSNSGDKTLRPGASGGLVVDHETQRIVGVLTATAKNEERIAIAVPAQTLADFVEKVQPFLAQKIFPRIKRIPPISPDFYPRFAETHLDELQHRPEESAAVKTLRNKSQDLADGMRNFVAVQSFAWGAGEKEEPRALAKYEVKVLQGDQTFREYPDGKKEMRELPFPAMNDAFVPMDEWSYLPQMVGTELKLRIHQAPDVDVKGRRLRVFQYSGKIEDAVCPWKYVFEFGFFSLNKHFVASCYGEVWLDEDSNIVRISEHHDLPDKNVFDGEVTYGWLERAGESPRRIPLTFSTKAEFGKKTVWCRGQFTDYRIFDSSVRIVANKP